MRGRKTWALVMSGMRARILRGLESAEGEEPIELVSQARSPHLRDIMADKPGRSFASAGGGRRSAMEPGGDVILRDMQDFAQDTGLFLERHRRAGDFERLAVMAEARMLGVLREELPQSVLTTVFLELPMNLVPLPERDLRTKVLDLIRSHRAAE
ncbi:host attachment protein [Roseicyclus sp.]|uniref:host attachment protein n=1 Tax=Roseicyclus sp. TaxID=1914329 RepID=UPI003F9F553F